MVSSYGAGAVVDKLRPRPWRGQGLSSLRAVARRWALGLALPRDHRYCPWSGSPRPGLLLGAERDAEPVSGCPSRNSGRRSPLVSMGAGLVPVPVAGLRNWGHLGSQWRLTTFDNHYARALHRMAALSAAHRHLRHWSRLTAHVLSPSALGRPFPVRSGTGAQKS